MTYIIKLDWPLCCEMSKTCRPNHARYIVNKKCTNMYENEDADQLRGNCVTYQRLCSRFLNWKTDESSFRN